MQLLQSSGHVTLVLLDALVSVDEGSLGHVHQLQVALQGALWGGEDEVISDAW